MEDWRNGIVVRQPRRAGVSSFGIGGTNAHVVVEEAQALETSSNARPVQLLLLSAKNRDGARQSNHEACRTLQNKNPALNLADMGVHPANGPPRIQASANAGMP